MFSFWFSGFRVYICVALLLAAAQMCFCSIKRKSRLKPAKFFIALKIAEGGILPAFSEGRPKGRFAPEAYRLLSGSDADLRVRQKRRRADRSPPLK